MKNNTLPLYTTLSIPNYSFLRMHTISAHEWVIDGALAQRKTIDGSSRLRFLYHCNWGWNGSCNGYFLGTAFNPYNSDKYKFNYNLKATLFITKP